MQFLESRTAVLGAIFLAFGSVCSSELRGADAIATVQNRLRATLQYRAAISSLDVEFDAKSGGNEEYGYVRRFQMLGDLRKQEDWIDGHALRIVEDVRNAPDISRRAKGRVRQLALFDGERHAIYSTAVADAAMSLTDREMMPQVSACRFLDARLVGLIPIGYDSMISQSPEEFYLSKKAIDGRVEQDGPKSVLRWKVVWPRGAADFEVTLDPDCDGQPTYVHHSWTEDSDRGEKFIRVEYGKTNGVYFPSNIDYQRFDGDRRTEWEKIDVRVIHLNQGLDRSDFSLAQADVPPLTPVSLSRGNTESLWWDGQKVVGLEELQAYQRRRRMQQWSVAGVLGVAAAAAVTFVLLRRRKK